MGIFEARITEEKLEVSKPGGKVVLRFENLVKKYGKY